VSKKWILIAFVLFLTVPETAVAITPQQFDAMPCDAREQYVWHLLIGAGEGLEAHNKDGAEKLKAIMANRNAQFYGQFYENVQSAREINAANAAKPNNGGEPIYEVENALAVTTKQNGVIVPVSYLLTVNRDFVPKAPLAYASEPVWPWNVSASYKKAVMDLMETTNHAGLGYQDMRCKLNEQKMTLDARLEKLTTEAPSLSEGHHAYVTTAGTLVDERGIRLTGVNLQKASAMKKENLPSFEEFKATQTRLKKINDIQDKMVADHRSANENWDKALKEVQDCVPMKCTYK
jgi:hypothetical protein